MTQPSPKAQAVIDGMRLWLTYGKREKPAKDGRSREEQAWDQAVLACGEFVRRYMDYEECVALQLHGLLTPMKDK
jgi:hypothetical protein